MGLDEKTPAEKFGIKVEGENNGWVWFKTLAKSKSISKFIW